MGGVMGDMEVGFTAEDRKSLNILENEMKHMTAEMRDLGVRMSKLEETRLSARDLEQTYQEVDELRQQKADKEMAQDHEARLRKMELTIAKWMGGAMALSVMASLLVNFILAMFHK